MGTLKETASYLNGLTEGLELDESKKETKVIFKLIEMVNELAERVEDLEDYVDELDEKVDEIDHDLGEVEEYDYSKTNLKDYAKILNNYVKDETISKEEKLKELKALSTVGELVFKIERK